VPTLSARSCTKERKREKSVCGAFLPESRVRYSRRGSARTLSSVCREGDGILVCLSIRQILTRRERHRQTSEVRRITSSDGSDFSRERDEREMSDDVAVNPGESISVSLRERPIARAFMKSYSRLRYFVRIDRPAVLLSSRRRLITVGLLNAEDDLMNAS